MYVCESNTELHNCCLISHGLHELSVSVKHVEGFRGSDACWGKDTAMSPQLSLRVNV